MPELRNIAEKARSKNAGPFWVTVDIFCGSEAAYIRVRDGLTLQQLAECFQMPAQLIKRFDIEDLRVVKISVPRPTVQGMADDRDMHGASWGALVGELEIP